MSTTIKNSINRGSVSASTFAYGITNIITVARNVVGMGDVTGPSGSYTFWNASADVDLFYGLISKCINCIVSARLFQHNTNTGFYEVVGTGEHVDDLLNDEAVNQHFGMVWTSELELVDKVALTVNVSGLWNESLLVESGKPLNEVSNLSYYLNHEELCVGNGDSQPRIALKSKHLVSRNMNVIVGKCMKVTVGSPVNKNERMIPGETLEQLALFFGFSLDDFIVVAKETQQVLNLSSVIEGSTMLQLSHKVSVIGVLNKTWIVEHGTIMGRISELDGFWNNRFTLFNTANTNQVYKRDTPVLCDIVATIITSTRVVIEITPTDEVNTTDVIKSITDIVGADPSIVTVDVVRNDDGQVIEIIIIVDDENTATTIVGVINGIDTGTGCGAGILCRRTNAYVEGGMNSDASISSVSATLLFASFILFSHLF